MATGSQDGSILLWDAETGNLLDRTPDAFKIYPSSLGLSKANKLLASGWTYDNWNKRTNLKREAVVLSTKDRKFGAPESIATTIYGDAYVKNAQTDRLVRQPMFSPDGQMIAFVRSVPVPEASPMPSPTSPVVRAVQPPTSDEAVLYDLKKHQIIHQFSCMQIPAAAPSLLAFDSEGKHFGMACTDGGVQAWDLASLDTPQFRLYGYPLGETPLAFSSDLLRLATASSDFSVKVRKLWDSDLRERYKVVTLVGHTAGILGSTFTPDSKQLVTSSLDKKGNVWLLGPGHELSTFSGPWLEVAGIAFDPRDGQTLVGAIADQGHSTAEIWNTVTGGTEGTLSPHKGKVWSVSYSPDGKLIATGSDAVRIWDAKSRSILRSIAAPGPAGVIREVAFSPDGASLASVGDDGHARLWNVSSGALIHSFVINESGCESESVGRQDAAECPEMRGVAFSPDGTRLATANADSTATVWEIASGKLIQTLVGHNDVVWKVAFSPDGRYIATASHDGTAILWSAATGKEISVLSGHGGKLWGVAFSSDSKLIATASSDKTARIWNVETGREVLVLMGHSATVNRVAFSPDNKRLATSSEDGTARLYTLEIDSLMHLSGQRINRALTPQERSKYLRLK